jgi:hypothetical protein
VGVVGTQLPLQFAPHIKALAACASANADVQQQCMFILCSRCPIASSIDLLYRPWHRYADDMELEDAIHTALLTLKEGFEGQIAADNIEVHSRWGCVSQHHVCCAGCGLRLRTWLDGEFV